MADTPGVLVVKDGSSISRNIGIVTDNAGTEYVQHVQRPVPLLASAGLETSHIFAVNPASLHLVSVAALSDFAWLLLFDSTTVPPDGAVTPLAAIQATALVGTSISFGGAAAAMQAGVVAVLSTTGPFTKTSGPTGFFSALVR